MRRAQRFTEGVGGFEGGLQQGAGFGGSLATLGDLDGDGRAELAVAATRYDGLSENQGAVWIVSLRPDGRVAGQQQIGQGAGGFDGYLPPLARFGFSLAGLGDLDGDGTPDLMARVKRPCDDQTTQGGLWTLLLRPDGTTRRQQMVHAGTGSLATALSDNHLFGYHAVRIGDVDGNGVEDLAVGAPGDDVDGQDRGALWILMMDAKGGVLRHQKVSGQDGGFADAPLSGSGLGAYIVPMGDVNGDGTPDLVVARKFMKGLETNRGRVWLLLLTRTGRVKQSITLSRSDWAPSQDDARTTPTPFTAHQRYSRNAKNVVRLGDLDGNGVTDLLEVALPQDAAVLFLGADGQVLRRQPVSAEALGLHDDAGDLGQYGLLQLCNAGDFDGDGRETLALIVAPQNTDIPHLPTVRLLDVDATGTVIHNTALPLGDLPLRPFHSARFKQWSVQHQMHDYALGEATKWREGLAVYPTGDLNGDAVPDLALVIHPALLENPEDGNVWQVYMTRTGTVKRVQRLPLAAPAGTAYTVAHVVTSVVRLDPAVMGERPVLGLGRAFDSRDGQGYGALDVVQLAPAYYAWLPRLGYGALAVGMLALLMTMASRVQTRRLRLKNQQLEQVVQARTAEVAAQAQALQRANDIKAHFLANISHEFRTPLTLTFGPIQDLINGHYASLDQAQPHFERAQRNGQRLLRLINQLLDLAKMDAGSLELRLRHIDASQLVREIVGLFTSLAERQGLTLTVDTPEKLWLTCDPDHVEKMLVNLISNAFKFTPAGGMVTVTLHAVDEAAVLAVSDTGMGISAEEQRYVFERFYQVDGSARRAQDGTGIGLALVKELVTLHEGTIAVESGESGEGQGTTFTITLPHRDAPALAEDTAAPADLARQPHGDGAVLDGAVLDVAEQIAAGATAPDLAAATAGTHEEAPVVVLVEDHADLRAYIRSHLDPSFVILEAANGADGLAQEQVPDLILSDVMMPKMDGYALLEALKHDQRTSHIPVVLLTARADVESRIAGLERGADAYLAKPFDAGELTACLRGLIAQRRHLQQLWRTGAETPSTKGAAAADALPVPEQQFLARLDAVLAERFADPSFGADAVADALGLTPRQLLRKLKALTGQTTSERLRLHRLAVAHQLLSTSSTPVKAVVFAVGFTSGSYFAKQFKQAYGVTPSAHRAAHAAAAPD
ncbi:MAG: ATP-binding protein [Bacteroidota bacterium]